MLDSPTSEPEAVFVCECEEWMRSACDGEASYQVNELEVRSGKVEGKHYCVLHFPTKEKSSDFHKALKRKLENKDFNFCGVWFPDDLSLQGLTFDKDVDFRKAVFNGIADFRTAAFMAGSKFDDASFKARAAFDQVVFEGPASFQSTNFLGYAGFGRAKFVDRVSFLAAQFPGGLNFLHTVFISDADFHGSKSGGIASFRASRFSNVDFEYATFNEANFRDSTFSGTSDFSESLFESEANYFCTTFVGVANFYGVNFKGTSNFRRTRFGPLASFDRSTFNEASYFSHATFDGEAVFSEVTFKSNASFSRTNFAGSADFSYARFADVAGFVGDKDACVFSDVSSLNLQYSRVDKPGNLTFESLILRPHWFVNVDARRIDFINVDWNWRSLKGDVGTLVKMMVSSPHRLLAIAYRHLAVNAEENHRYEDASRFRYKAMDAQRREKWSGAAFWQLSWWYWLASGYGERAWQAAIVLVILWFMFASVFIIGQQSGQWWRPTQTHLQETTVSAAPKASADETLQITGFREALVYSAGVMTLQKPEPLPANKRAKTLVLLETILGPVQAAMLALAIRRKFMR